MRKNEAQMTSKGNEPIFCSEIPVNENISEIES